MVVGITRIEIFFPEAQSLKDKRQMIRKIVDRTRAKFNVSIIEIAESNLWQRGHIGFAVMGIKKDHIHSVVDKIEEFITSLYVGEIIDSWTEIIVMGSHEV